MQIFGEMKKGSIARKLAHAGIKVTRGLVQQPGGPYFSGSEILRVHRWSSPVAGGGADPLKIKKQVKDVKSIFHLTSSLYPVFSSKAK